MAYISRKEGMKQGITKSSYNPGKARERLKSMTPLKLKKGSHYRPGFGGAYWSSEKRALTKEYLRWEGEKSSYLKKIAGIQRDLKLYHGQLGKPSKVTFTKAQLRGGAQRIGRKKFTLGTGRQRQQLARKTELRMNIQKQAQRKKVEARMAAWDKETKRMSSARNPYEAEYRRMRGR